MGAASTGMGATPEKGMTCMMRGSAGPCRGGIRSVCGLPGAGEAQVHEIQAPEGLLSLCSRDL